jgi:phosphatidylserine decarboxylase
MSVGHRTDSAAHTADMKKVNPTNEEKQEAKRRIEGSLAPSAGADALPPGISQNSR